ncbi:MAG: NnrS family protein [Reyranellaceae bacterium]
MAGHVVDLLEPDTPAPYPAILAYGFRPMFFLASCQAALAVPVFLLLWLGTDIAAIAIAPTIWHGHEMLYGFAAAVLAGFLMTAVPNWTGMPPVRGGRLLALVVLWLAGRVAFWLSGVLPPALVAAVDLVFLPALGLAVAPALIGARNRRNYMFFVLLAFLFAGNAAIHAELLGLDPAAALDIGRRGQFLALDIFALMIAVVGGRIIPTFTGNFLRVQALSAGRTPPALAGHPMLDRLAMASLAVLALADAALGDRTPLVGVLCLLAAAANGARLAGWKGWSVRGEPILFVLHLGYAWLVLGLAVRGLDALFGFFVGAAGLHALTIGAIGTMTMAIMSRATLGHTGRAMKASGLHVLAFGLVSLAALLRLAGALPPLEALLQELLIASAVAWSVAFAAFAAILLPIVFRPRVDGLPG